MTTLKDLARDNPQIYDLYDVWRRELERQGLNPNDWPAFRAHLIDTGGPDPGEQPPTDFGQAVKRSRAT